MLATVYRADRNVDFSKVKRWLAPSSFFVFILMTCLGWQQSIQQRSCTADGGVRLICDVGAFSCLSLARS